LSELHGNSNMEICEVCGQKYFRDLRCRRMRRGRDHYTGRQCVRNECGGRLVSMTVDFGQDLPDEPIDNAGHHSGLSDLHLCLGSSLTVTPAADCPKMTKFNGGNLVIVNLQNTPLTPQADIHIYGRTDEVMSMVMEKLGYAIPEFRLHRKLIMGAAEDPVNAEKIILYARGADTEDPSLEMDFIEAMNWTESSLVPKVETEEEPVNEVTSQIPVNSLTTRIERAAIQSDGDCNSVIQMEFSFRGHYQEPELTLGLDVTPLLKSGRRSEYLCTLKFNPYTKEWNSEMEPSTVEDRVPEHDNSFGESHKEYVMGAKSWKKISSRPRSVREEAWERHVQQRIAEATYRNNRA